MKIVPIISVSFLAFFIFFILFFKWACSSPEHYELKRTDLQIVEIVKADYFSDTTINYQTKERTIDSSHYFELSKTNTVTAGHQYGLLITGEVEYCLSTSGNTAWAIPMPGRSGSLQVIESVKLVAINNSDHNVIDLSHSLLSPDSINNYGWNHNGYFSECQFLRAAKNINALRDSFNLSWFKQPPYPSELLYIIPHEIIAQCPSDFTFKLEIKYFDGVIQTSSFKGNKK